MKIQKLPNGEIQITFRPEEIANFQTALPLEDVQNVIRFEDCLHKVKYKTNMYLVYSLQCTKADLGNGKLRAVARYRESQRERDRQRMIGVQGHLERLIDIERERDR